MHTFNHGGDTGDLIYSLSTVRDLGGGELWLWPHYRARIQMSPEHAARIAPLCEAQPYVAKCIYKDKLAEINLDTFRDYYDGRSNLFRRFREVFKLPDVDDTEPWLTVPNPKKKYELIVHRSSRYHNDVFPWKKIVEKYGQTITMVGLECEHKEFCKRFGEVSYIKTENFLELAELIAGCSLFIGNQSAPFAIAEGLKKRVIQESDVLVPNCQFKRNNATYFMDGDLSLPDL
jgi:hypothetical protein